MEQSGTESWMDAEMQGVRYGPDDPVGVPVVDLPEPGARHDHPAGERQQRVPVGARRDGRRHPPRQVLSTARAPPAPRPAPRRAPPWAGTRGSRSKSGGSAAATRSDPASAKYLEM